MSVTAVLILGAGGHAQVLIDSLSGTSEIVGLTDADVSKRGAYIQGIEVLGDDDVLQSLSPTTCGVIVGVGDNQLRSRLFTTAVDLGFHMVNAVHPQAVISRYATLGHGVAVMAGAVINTQAQIGDNAIVNTGATVDHDCVIGAHAHVAPGTHLGGGVQIGEGAFVGIGANVVPQVSVGNWAVVGAGATVIEDVPPHAVVVGVPARILRKNKPC